MGLVYGTTSIVCMSVGHHQPALLDKNSYRSYSDDTYINNMRHHTYNMPTTNMYLLHTKKQQNNLIK